MYEQPTTNSLPSKLIDSNGIDHHNGNINGNNNGLGDLSEEEDNVSLTKYNSLQITQTITNTKQSNKTLQNFRNVFKRNFSKDFNEQIIDRNELFQNFQEVLSNLSKADEYSFIEFEICLMMAKYFTEKQMPKNEIYHFINYSIYISNLNIKEESRVSSFLRQSLKVLYSN